jgi:hypothetical protein
MGSRRNVRSAPSRPSQLSIEILEDRSLPSLMGGLAVLGPPLRPSTAPLAEWHAPISWGSGAPAASPQLDRLGGLETGYGLSNVRPAAAIVLPVIDPVPASFVLIVDSANSLQVLVLLPSSGYPTTAGASAGGDENQAQSTSPTVAGGVPTVVPEPAAVHAGAGPAAEPPAGGSLVALVVGANPSPINRSEPVAARNDYRQPLLSSPGDVARRASRANDTSALTLGNAADQLLQHWGTDNGENSPAVSDPSARPLPSEMPDGPGPVPGLLLGSALPGSQPSGRGLPMLSAGLLGDIFQVDVAAMGQGIRNFLADVASGTQWVVTDVGTGQPVRWTLIGLAAGAIVGPWLYTRLRKPAADEDDLAATDLAWAHLPHLAELPAGDRS